MILEKRVRTFWFCQKCKTTAWTNHGEHDGGMTVVREIGKDHRRLAPKCDSPVSAVQVVNWEKLLSAEMPEWAVKEMVNLITWRL